MSLSLVARLSLHKFTLTFGWIVDGSSGKALTLSPLINTPELKEDRAIRRDLWGNFRILHRLLRKLIKMGCCSSGKESEVRRWLEEKIELSRAT